MSDVIEKASPSRFGYSGHFMLSGLTEIADRYGLVVETAGPNSYKVRMPTGDLNDLCPSYIQHDNDIFNAKNIRGLLNFLHQPVRASLQKSHKGQHDARARVHDYLWLATAGKARPQNMTVEGPCKMHGDGCNGVGCDNHIDMQRDMEREQDWLGKTEVGRNGLLPALSFDEERGLFTLRLDDLSEAIADDTFLAEISVHFRQQIETLEGPLSDSSQIIHLNASQLESLISQIANNDTAITHTMQASMLRERTHERIEAVEKRARSFEISNAVHTCLAANDPADSKERLMRLLESTSALHDIADSDILREAWTRYHFSSRHEPPSAAIAQEFATLKQTLEHYAAQDRLSPETLEAIGAEFYPLLALGKHMAETLDLEACVQAFSDANIHKSDIAPEFLPPDAKKTLEITQRIKGGKNSIVGNVFTAGVESSRDFIMDTIHFVKESPTAAAVAALITVAMFVSKAQADAAQAAYLATHASVVAFGDGGMHVMNVDPKTLPAGSFNTQSWHWNIGLLGPYKHYAQDTFVVGSVRTALDFFRAGVFEVFDKLNITPNLNSGFSVQAEKAVIPLADKLFKANLFQNMSHSVFWLYMISKGWQHRLQGSKKILGLFSPITDLACYGALAGKEKLTRRSSESLQKRLLALTDETRAKLPEIDSSELPAALVEAAAVRNQLEGTLSGDTPASELLKAKGLQNKFRISSENIAPTLEALDIFDSALTHISNEIGVKYGWHRENLRDSIRALSAGLKSFQHDGDLQALKACIDTHLQNIIGAEIRQKGASGIYSALFNTAADTAQENTLLHNANAEFGRQKRRNAVKENGQKFAKGSIIQKAKSALVIAGALSWQQIVAAMRTLEKTFHRIPHKKAFAYVAAGAGGAATLLDMSGQTHHLLGTMPSQVVEALSQGSGTAAASALTLSMFVLYNFFEDVLGLHVFGGGSTYITGALGRTTLAPLGAGTAEKIRHRTGVDLRREWQKLRQRMPRKQSLEPAPPEPSF